MGNTQTKTGVSKDTHLKVTTFTAPHPIEDGEWKGIRLETTKDYITVSELATFLTKLLETHPEFADVGLERDEDEWGTHVEIKESGLRIL